MPELPEVEAMFSRLAPLISGTRFLSLDLLTPHAKSLLHGKPRSLRRGTPFTGISRHGKVGMLQFGNAAVALFQLGMSGRLVLRAPSGEHDHIALRLSNGKTLVYADHRRFGAVHVWPYAESAQQPPLNKLGPDALRSEFGSICFPSTARAVKTVLLDQSVIAGLGNIYACEVLYRAGIDPRRPFSTLSKKSRKRLFDQIPIILAEAIAAGGSTLDDYRGTEGETGTFESKFAVYGRAGLSCPNCNCRNSVIQISQAGRSSWLCAKRQR